jgi:hypothetical protein
MTAEAFERRLMARIFSDERGRVGTVQQAVFQRLSPLFLKRTVEQHGQASLGGQGASRLAQGLAELVSGVFVQRCCWCVTDWTSS